MYKSNKERYISNQSVTKAEAVNTDDTINISSESLKVLTAHMDRLKSTVDELNKKALSFDAWQAIVKIQIGSLEEKLLNTTSELHKIMGELENYKREYGKSIKKQPPQNSNAPLMPGLAFSTITPDFLKSLGKK